MLALQACSNANLGWLSFPGKDGHLHGSFPPLRVSGPTFTTAPACSGPFEVSFIDSSGRNLVSFANVPLQLSGTGAPTFFADSSCLQPITSTELAQGSDHQDFYLLNAKLGP